MSEQVKNPFEDEKPKLVHFEKDDSHYEYCRMQMHDIEKTHRRTFFCNTALCILVCILGVFKQYIALFDLLSAPMAGVEAPGAILAGGVFQIIFAMIIALAGYLAWANWHTLNIFLGLWYIGVTIVGIVRLDYISALIGIVGVVFYFFSFREMGKEETLSQMEGYPEFHEKFDITKSDIIIQTLLAHQGEKRTKSTLFTTDYSLRKKKKKRPVNPELAAAMPDDDEKEKTDSGQALAEALQHITKAAEEKAAEDKQPEAAAQQTAAEEAAADTAAAPAAEETAAEEAVPEQSAAEEAAQPAMDAQSEADAILAAAEERAKKILEEAEERVRAMEQQSGFAEETVRTEEPAADAASAPAKPSAPHHKKKKKR